MAVNYADGFMFASIVMYPIIAGKAALSQGFSWLMLLFLPLSICIGIVVIYLGRKLTYGILGPCVKRIERMTVWIQYILGTPLLLLYFVLPLAITGAGLYCTWIGSMWLVQNIIQM